jgi:hypothetical protein
MKKSLCLVLCVSIFIAGCGGQTANPVDRYISGDEGKSCNSLFAEMAQIDTEIREKKADKDHRDTMNIVCFVTGLFIIVPFFFMDVKGSQEVEIDALTARKKALMNIYNDKNCSAPAAVAN